MAYTPITATCTHCHETFICDEKPKKTSLGFLKIPCPFCQKTTIAPLTQTTRIIYIVFCIAAIGLTVHAIMQGQVAFPGIISIFAGYALIKDMQLRKN